MSSLVNKLLIGLIKIFLYYKTKQKKLNLQKTLFLHEETVPRKKPIEFRDSEIFEI